MPETHLRSHFHGKPSCPSGLEFKAPSQCLFLITPSYQSAHVPPLGPKKPGKEEPWPSCFCVPFT